MEIKVLGTGCKKCQVLESQVRRVVEALDRKDINITKVENIKDIMSYNILSTPALVINEKVKVFGRIPSSDEITRWIKEI
ncbi:MAG: redox-active disulfide protein 2 [Tenericutes bacterium HGW-Tenericutes-6]|jgi:small redox-active disulfide protein 2|nr:MAG: redox-active disulfide protein 2 [Tenericutes bacterium HGW-Tenericutes-6]